MNIDWLIGEKDKASKEGCMELYKYKMQNEQMQYTKEPAGKYRRDCQIQRKHLSGKMKEGGAGGTDVKVDIFDQQIET